MLGSMAIALGDIGQAIWLRKMVVALKLVTTVAHTITTSVSSIVANLLRDGNYQHFSLAAYQMFLLVYLKS